MSRNQYERLEDHMGPASSSSLRGAKNDPYYPNMHTYVKFNVYNGRAWLQLGDEQRPIDAVSDLPVTNIALLPGTAESLTETDKRLYKRWTRFIFDERIQFYGPFSCLKNFIRTLHGPPGPVIVADIPVPLYVGNIKRHARFSRVWRLRFRDENEDRILHCHEHGSLTKYDYDEEDIVYAGCEEQKCWLTWPEETILDISIDISYKIRDKLRQSFDAGLLDLGFVPPLVVGPLKPDREVLMLNDYADVAKIPPEKKVRVKITTGGVKRPTSVSGPLPDEKEDMVLLDDYGHSTRLTRAGLIFGKDYALEVLDKGEIYIEMVWKKFARRTATAIKRFKPVQGFFERAAALDVPKKLALVAAKQSGVDLREFSNLCALGQGQEVDTSLQMATLSELAAAVFPVRLATFEANLAGYTLNQVTESIYHATPDAQSDLKVNVLEKGDMRIAGTFVDDRQKNCEEGGGTGLVMVESTHRLDEKADIEG